MCKNVLFGNQLVQRKCILIACIFLICSNAQPYFCCSIYRQNDGNAWEGKGWLRSHVSVFVKSRHGTKERSRAWPGGQEVKPVRRQKLINSCVFTIWCLAGNSEEAPWDQPWHISIHFPNAAGLWGQANKVTCLLGKATTFRGSWRRKGEVWKLISGRMTLLFWRRGNFDQVTQMATCQFLHNC